jgi:antitoxin VapB
MMEVSIMETAKIFVNGRSQAVRLPKDCRFSGKEVGVKKVGDVVLLFQVDSAWANFLNAPAIDDDVWDSVLSERKNMVHQERECL